MNAARPVAGRLLGTVPGKESFCTLLPQPYTCLALVQRTVLDSTDIGRISPLLPKWNFTHGDTDFLARWLREALGAPR